MIEARNFFELLEPVFIQSMRFEHTHKGLIDRAAQEIVDQLDLNTYSNASDTHKSLKHGSHLLSHMSHWFDLQACQFFQSHPEALGIEINGGLSTRFHRLCQKNSWPRFYWQTINSHDISGYISAVFPVIDNFQVTAVISPYDDWFEHVDWESPRPKLVILDEYQKQYTWSDLKNLLLTLKNRLPTHSAVDILVAHGIENLVFKSQSVGLNISLENEQFITRKSNPLKKGLIRTYKNIKRFFKLKSHYRSQQTPQRYFLQHLKIQSEK